MSADQVAFVFAAATALHLGFQVTVTLLVYPVLARVGPADWPAVHDRHSRTITPLVGVVYVVLVLAVGGLLATEHSAATVALVAVALTPLAITGFVAGPLHSRLTTPDPRPLRRLLAADRARTATAAFAFVLALGHALG